MRTKPYWKNREELAKRSSFINDDLKSLVRLAKDGHTMNTVNEFGYMSVRHFMDGVFLSDLPHQAAIDPVIKAMF